MSANSTVSRFYTNAGRDRLQTFIRSVLHLRPPDIERHKKLFTFSSAETVSDTLQCASDADWGGASDAHLTFTPPAAARFKGVLASAQSHAGFQTRPLPRTLLSGWRHKLEPYSHVCLIARLRTFDCEEGENLPPVDCSSSPHDNCNPDAAAPTAVVVAAETDGVEDMTPDSTTISTGLRVMFNIKASVGDDLELYQYPLAFSSNNWHRFTIPMRNFIKTQDGYVRQSQNPLFRNEIEWFGVSISSLPGPFCIDVSEIAASNPPGLSDNEMEDAYIAAVSSGNHEAVREIDRIRDEYKINI